MNATQRLIVVGLTALIALAPPHSEATETLECISKLTGLPFGKDGKLDVLINDEASVTYYVEIPMHRRVDELPSVLTQLVGAHGWEKSIQLVIYGEIDMARLGVAIDNSIDSMNEINNHMIGSWSNVTIIYVGTEIIAPKLLSAVGKANITLRHENVDIGSDESRKNVGC